jgi:hypothetical protein
VFIGASIDFGECFSHHVEFGLAVPLEDICIPLSQHERDKMIGDTAGTETTGERVA